MDFLKTSLTNNVLFLIIVEINHPPRIREPHSISIAKLFNLIGNEFRCDYLTAYEFSGIIYDSIRKGKIMNNMNKGGILLCKLVKNGEGNELK